MAAETETQPFLFTRFCEVCGEEEGSTWARNHCVFQ